MIITVSYSIYLVVSIGLTVWVARTLQKNGRPFLVEAFQGNETVADSINHLLVVGFYLINFGYVSLAMEASAHPQTIPQAMELLSLKLGWVLVILGVMHFLNLFIFTQYRNSRTRELPEVGLTYEERTRT